MPCQYCTREFDPIAHRWICPVCHQKNTCCEGAPLPESATFVESCVAGTAEPADVDEWMDCWHNSMGSPRGHEEHLHEYLGLTWSEFDLWVAAPSSLSRIVAGRENSAECADPHSTIGSCA